jgi:hypothetical protein
LIINLAGVAKVRNLTRRKFTAATVSLPVLAGCTNSVSSGQCELVIANQTDGDLRYDGRVTGEDGETVLSAEDRIPQGGEDTLEFSFESVDTATIELRLDLDRISLRLDDSADYAQWDVEDGNITVVMEDTPSFLTYTLTAQQDGTVGVSLESSRQAV